MTEFIGGCGLLCLNVLRRHPPQDPVPHNQRVKQFLSKRSRGKKRTFYPPLTTTTNRVTRKIMIPPIAVSRSNHFSPRSLLFTCASVSFESHQRTIEK